MLASGHFTFSHGHLLKVVSHDPSLVGLFSWEELWMSYTYWKKGFTLYSPVENTESQSIHPFIIYYKYGENQNDLEDYRTGREIAAKNVRSLIMGDEKFRRYMDVKWGVDLFGRQGSQRATDGGLDSFYFFGTHEFKKDK